MVPGAVLTPAAELATGPTVAARDAAGAGTRARDIVHRATGLPQIGPLANLVVRLDAALLDGRARSTQVVEEARSGAAFTGATARPIGAAHGLAALRRWRAAVAVAMDKPPGRVAALTEMVAMTKVRRHRIQGNVQRLFGGRPRFVADNDGLGSARSLRLVGPVRLDRFLRPLGSVDPATP
jgi:hypothetical protein